MATMRLYQPVGDDELAYLDYSTLEKFRAQVERLAYDTLRSNAGSAAVIVTMGKGGVNPAAKLYASSAAAADEFYELNNSGAYDAGVIYMARKGQGLGEGIMGPLPHSKPTLITKFKSAAPWIVLAALGVSATVYYTRRTIKRRRAARGG